MTALWLEPETHPASGPDLRLLGSVVPTIPDDEDTTQYGPSQGLRLVEAPRHAPGRPRRRASLAVRRRRTLLAAVAAFTVVLALPLSGTGGHSHTTGSAPAENGGVSTYTVKPGDTLWSIAAQVDPTADPRPLVAKLAAQTGSDSVVPGERIALP